MCGVCGIAIFTEPSALDATRRRVSQMVEVLMHRGPDESGVVGTGTAVLGATRLAIRGVHSGKQPIEDRETGVVVVCNGEIDNHRELRSWLKDRGRMVEQETDIAVIPGLYLELGDAFVEKLAGVFAIAVWDPRVKRLLLARDRVGERPLFFTIPEGEAHFATEIAALAADTTRPLTFNRDTMRGYLQFGCFIAPTTPFAEIQKVAPAEIVTIEGNRVSRRRYWRWNIADTPKRPGSEDGFDPIFREAVRRQSDVDVEYGVFLSGGLDSSLIAAVLKKLRPERKLKAYTLRFGESSYDEGHFAQQVAAQLGFESVPIWVKPEDFPVTIAELIQFVGEPLADPAWIPTALMARRAAQDMKVALVGEGGDELFGGYPTYLGAGWSQRYAGLPRPVKSLVRSIANALPPSDKKVTISFLLKRFVEGADMNGFARHLLWTSNISSALMERLGVTATEPRSVDASPESLLDIVQQHDLETSLAEGLLTKADRASMSYALELRAPFLDQSVLEFAATLPAEERVRGMTTKVFLKRYALRYLPGSIVHRRKRGLSVPLSAWLRESLHGWAESRLRSDQLERVGIKSAVALELLEEHRQRKANHARALWTLIVLSEWLEWAKKRMTNR